MQNIQLYRAARLSTLERAFHGLLCRPAIAATYRCLRLDRGAGPARLPRSAAETLFGRRLNLEVDPQRLTHRAPGLFVSGGRVRRLKDFWTAAVDSTGDRAALSEVASHRIVAQIVAASGRFRQTADYEAYAAMIRDGGSPRKRLTTIAALDRYCEGIARLIDSIDRHGFRRLGEVDGPAAGNGERDVGIAFDAAGTMLFAEKGNHRLAAARALGLDRIPVHLMFVDRTLIDASPGDTLMRRAEAFLADIPA